MKRAAIELSMNFIVVFILCMVIMGIGIFLFNKFKVEADDYIKQVDELQQKELDRYLVSGKSLAIADEIKDVERGRFTTYFIGIENVLPDAANFSIEVRVSQFTLSSNSITETEANSWVANPYQTFGLANKERKYTTIGIKPEAGNPGKGQYLFNVDVCYGASEGEAECNKPGYSNRYFQPMQIYVNVK